MKPWIQAILGEIYSDKHLGRGRFSASGGRRNPRLLLKISLESQGKKKTHV